MMNIKLNKETFLQLRLKGKSFFSNLPRWLLVDHLRLLIALFFILAFLSALYFMFNLFFTQPDSLEDELSLEQTLRVDLIDELEFWIEERDREGQRPILNLERRYFNPN